MDILISHKATGEDLRNGSEVMQLTLEGHMIMTTWWRQELGRPHHIRTTDIHTTLT